MRRRHAVLPGTLGANGAPPPRPPGARPVVGRAAPMAVTRGARLARPGAPRMPTTTPRAWLPRRCRHGAAARARMEAAAPSRRFTQGPTGLIPRAITAWPRVVHDHHDQAHSP